MTRRKSKLVDKQESKSDNSVKVTLISTIGIILTTLITALFAPVILKALDKTPTPLPVSQTLATAPALVSDVYVEDFSKGSLYWETAPIDDDVQKSSVSLSNGVFRWRVTGKQNGYLAGVPSNSAYSDFDLELTLELVDVSPKTNYLEYGIEFRDSEQGDYYFFLNSDGKYSLKKYSQDKKWTDLISFTKTTYMNLNGANVFRVRCKGSNIRLWLNQNFVGDWNDNSFSSGKLAIVTWADKDITVTLDMTSFKLTLLSP